MRRFHRNAQRATFQPSSQTGVVDPPTGMHLYLGVNNGVNRANARALARAQSRNEIREHFAKQFPRVNKLNLKVIISIAENNRAT